MNPDPYEGIPSPSTAQMPYHTNPHLYHHHHFHSYSKCSHPNVCSNASTCTIRTISSAFLFLSRSGKQRDRSFRRDLARDGFGFVVFQRGAPGAGLTFVMYFYLPTLTYLSHYKKKKEEAISTHIQIRYHNSDWRGGVLVLLISYPRSFSFSLVFCSFFFSIDLFSSWHILQPRCLMTNPSSRLCLLT